MTLPLARLVMALATRCLGRERGAWARAMRGEFEAAVDDRRPLAFALGCLAAAWRAMPGHDEGRFVLARYLLALGLIVPLAAFHLGCAGSGLRFLLAGPDSYYTLLAQGGGAAQQLAGAYRSAVPAMTALLLALGIGHLLIAWTLLDCRWRRVAALWALTAAAAATLVAIIVALAPSAAGIAVQVAGLAIELAAVPALAAWHRRRAFRDHCLENAP